MITKAVIPAAGFGTRFLPITKAIPKEMIPIIDTPTIQYVVEEAVDSGIEDILIISGKDKRAIEDHFDSNPALESRLAEKADQSWYKMVRHISNLANIHIIRQKELNGLGDAIRHARWHVGNHPFAILLGDTILHSDSKPVTRQLIDVYREYHQSVVAVQRVPQDKVSRYGIVGGHKISENIWEMTEMIEKPAPETAPSNLAFAGRYILTASIFDKLDETPRGKNDEIQLTDAMKALLADEKTFACIFDGKRYDIGNKLDYLKTLVEYGLRREEFSDDFRTFLKTVI